jgi:uncharacterized protein YozE (UPF0346 family)
MIKKATKLSPSTGFTHWMLKWRITDNTRIGMLAREIAQDSQWPRMATNCQQLLSYLECSDVSMQKQTVLVNAWTMYQAAMKRLNHQANARDRDSQKWSAHKPVVA